jgi:hypothetical protein
MVVVFEMALAFGLLYKGPIVRGTLSLAGIFMLLLVPFWWSGGSLLNLVFASMLFWQAQSEYPTAVWELWVEKR